MKRTGILLLALLLFGCVKTPDTEPIVSKADGALEQAIAASPVPITLELDATTAPDLSQTPLPISSPMATMEPFPTHWEEDAVLAPGILLSIRTDLTLPEQPVYPVYRVEPFLPSPAWAQHLAEAFLPEPVSIQPNERTKKDWEREFGAFLADTEAQQTGEQDDLALSQEEIDAESTFYMERIREAPEENLPHAVSDYRNITPRSTNVFTGSDGTKAIVSLSDRGLLICKDCDDAPYLLYESQYEADRVWNPNMERLWKPVTMAQADAKAAAIQAMESLGFSDFRIAEANPTNLLSGIGGQRSIGTGWSFVFLRDYGYPLLRRYAASSFLSFDETGSAAYRAPLYEEHIEVFADESGVRFLSVFNPRKLLGTENENVSLLPFSEVLARLKDVIRFGLSEYADNDSIRPEIYEAVLTTHTVPIRNSDAYYVLPVWVFLLDPTGYMPHDERITREAVILNAIDGSVILPDR